MSSVSDLTSVSVSLSCRYQVVTGILLNVQFFFDVGRAVVFAVVVQMFGWCLWCVFMYMCVVRWLFFEHKIRFGQPISRASPTGELVILGLFTPPYFFLERRFLGLYMRYRSVPFDES